MEDTRPTGISFCYGITLCLLLLFAPKKFKELEEADNQILTGIKREYPAFVVRRAFFSSGCLVLASGMTGFSLGVFLGHFFICASPAHIAWLQIIGACLLLWGTLFIRGCEIQTRGGITLTEQVNQWIYRCIYCVGTAILVFSLAWTQCSPAANPAAAQDAPKMAYL